MAETCNPGECEGDPTYDNPIPVNPYPADSGSYTGKSVVVDELPDEGVEGVIYWVAKPGSDAYDMYQWIDGAWRKLDVDTKLYQDVGNNSDGAMTQKATTDALALKASKSEVSSLANTVSGKADQSDLNTLANTVSGKANQSDLSTLADTVEGKADQSDLDAKADQSDLDDLADEVADKADKSEVKTYTGGKRITINQDDSIDADGLVILSYGNSTWQDFLAAYNDNAIVYCKASSETNPALGSQGRLAFMAFITNPTNPTAVEFQYFRSVTKKDATQQCDQIFVYKLTSANKWTVEIRNVASKIVAGTGLSSTYDNGELTLEATGGGSSSITYYVNDWLPDDTTQLDGKDVYKDAECTTSLTGGEFFDDVNSGKPIRIVFDSGDYPIETTFLYGFSMPRDKEELSFDNWNPQGHFDFLGRRFTILFQHYQASATGCWSIYVDEPA